MFPISRKVHLQKLGLRHSKIQNLTKTNFFRLGSYNNFNTFHLIKNRSSVYILFFGPKILEIGLLFFKNCQNLPNPSIHVRYAINYNYNLKPENQNPGRYRKWYIISGFLNYRNFLRTTKKLLCNYYYANIIKIS